jgi:hypothetical protein
MSVLFMMVSVGIYCRNISGEFDRHGCIMRVDSDGVCLHIDGVVLSSAFVLLL